ncbi:MAG TPA: GDSL-type esterase/lipase family protein [Micromonosporaceae bacterium]|nr:GDSL-type esterase/lipase family protein [Micromonosporaceae bacterium]
MNVPISPARRLSSRKRRTAVLAAAASMIAAAVFAAAAPAPAYATNAGSNNWTGTWATALTPDGGIPGFDNQSVRMLVRVSIGGEAFRLRLSNEHGDRDVMVGHLSVGRPVVASQPDIDPSTLTTVTFDGSTTVVIPKGQTVVSDPVPLALPPLSQLAVTLFFPEPTGPPSVHLFAKQTAYIYDGDHAGEAAGAGNTGTTTHFFFLAGIEVINPEAGGAVAVLGASISDGFGSTDDANTRWPDFLAERLVTSSGTDLLGVLNVSLSGNMVGHDGDEDNLPLVGVKAIDRLDRDVYPHAGVRTVIVDLGLADQFAHQDSAFEIIKNLHELSVALRRHGYRVLLATLSPAASSTGGDWTPQQELTRQLVNLYIRSGIDSDGVVDIDKALRDPANPTHVRGVYTVDGVHPNDLGSQAIANAVQLSLL